MKKNLILLFIILSISLFSEPELNKQFLLNYLNDGAKVVTSPLRWDKTDWLKAGVISGVTVGLYTLADEEIQKNVQNNKTDFLDEFANGPRLLGDGLFVLGSQAGVYLYGNVTDNEKLMRASLLSLESYIISGGIVMIMKASGQRHRPYEDDGHNVWDGPSLFPDHRSFPSGHSSSAFSVATVFATVYSDVRFVPTISYSLATLAALSRVYDDKHWSSDIFFGSAVGYFTAKAIVKYNTGKTGLAVYPSINDDDIYLNCNVRF
jgi:membrane-associated phospholipid phosphatase